VANSSNYLDFEITGKVTSGTTPTTPAEHRLYFIKSWEDTPSWGGGIAGTGDAAATITSTNILATLVLGWSGTASATTNVVYHCVNALTMAQAFGICPKNFLLYFTHAHTAALYNDSSNNNSFYYRGIYATIT
jgi:hypothetical protein